MTHRLLRELTNTVCLSAFRDRSSSLEIKQEETETTRSRRALGENEKQRLSREVSACIPDYLSRPTQVLEPSVGVAFRDGE